MAKANEIAGSSIHFVSSICRFSPPNSSSNFFILRRCISYIIIVCPFCWRLWGLQFSIYFKKSQDTIHHQAGGSINSFDMRWRIIQWKGWKEFIGSLVKLWESVSIRFPTCRNEFMVTLWSPNRPKIGGMEWKWSSHSILILDDPYVFSFKSQHLGRNFIIGKKPFPQYHS